MFWTRPHPDSELSIKHYYFHWFPHFEITIDWAVVKDLSVTSMTRKLLLIVAVIALLCGFVPIRTVDGQDGIHVNLTELNRRADKIETRVDDSVKAISALTARQDDIEKREDQRENLMVWIFTSLVALVGERVAAVIFGAKARMK